MTWQEQDWGEAYEALEDAARRLRCAQRTMLDREMTEDEKSDRISAALHGARRFMDDCAALTEADEVIA